MQNSISIIRLPAVMARVNICRTGIYMGMRQGSFPKSVQLGPKAVGWVESEIDDWLREKVVASRSSEKQREVA